MKIQHLGLVSFRNISGLRWEPSPGRNIILGDNGQGKTNLLESIYVILNLKSMRTQSDFKPLISRGSKFFNIHGVLSDDSEEKTDILLAYDGVSRKLTVNGNVSSSRDFLRHRAMVYFSPDQATMLADSPDMRRRITDRYIFTLYPEYFDILNKFKSMMKKRNTVLKHSGDTNLLNAIDISFAPVAFRISQLRKEIISRITDDFKNYWSEIKPEMPPMGCSYGGTHHFPESSSAYFEILRKNTVNDIRLGRTSHGPHVEDIHFSIDGELSKNFLSHGERKIASFCFNLAFAKLLGNQKKLEPVVLIDDISSELDEISLEGAVNSIFDLGFQTIVTTLDREFIEKWGNNTQNFRIEQGNVTEIGI
ncbi:MAG: DNA replication and repair protein RecF [Deltaproteobacteria bacterium]|nr:DNA replication and repair protein RecF [Deltaproteobacteria bacterium]